MIEVEVKLPLYRRSLTEAGLRNLGFSTGDLLRESDTYFNSSFHDFIKRDEALRIRTTENLSQRTSSSFLTFKGPKVDDTSMTRKELEIRIDDAATAVEIINALGFTKHFPVKKLRQTYHLDDITACVDQVEGLGSFLELEILVAQESQRPAALKRIEEILLGIGSGMFETTRHSYLSMLMKKKGIYPVPDSSVEPDSEGNPET